MKYFLEWLRNYLIEKRDWKRDKKQCMTCIALQDQLVIERTRNEKLLEHIIQLTSPKAPEAQEISEKKPLYPAKVPWPIRAKILEAEDRKKAELERELNKAINSNNRDIKKENDELENELKAIAEKNDKEMERMNNAG